MQAKSPAMPRNQEAITGYGFRATAASPERAIRKTRNPDARTVTEEKAEWVISWDVDGPEVVRVSQGGLAGSPSSTGRTPE